MNNEIKKAIQEKDHLADQLSENKKHIEVMSRKIEQFQDDIEKM